MENWNQVQPKLEQRGFVTRRFATAADARAALIREIPDNASIGLGGSVSVQSLDLQDELSKHGCTFYNHSAVSPDKVDETLLNAQFADYYLAGCNAVDESGVLYNIDARGNRVAAMLFGTGKLILVIGCNKIAPAGDGFARIRREACGKNCRRLGRNTPCSKTDKCAECTPAAGRICNAFVRMEAPAGRKTELWLVDEPMGY